MQRLGPYRWATLDESRPLPSLEWTRMVNLLVAVLGCVAPTFALLPLLDDHDCSGTPIPHVAEAFVLTLMTAALAYGSVRASWSITAWAICRERPRVGALASFGPTVTHVVVTALFAAWLTFEETFRICLAPDAGSLFSFGC